MGYKNLIRFKDIFNRNDFNYISDPKHIEYIIDIISYKINDKEILSDYINNLSSFYNDINGRLVRDIKIGYLKVYDLLNTIIGIINNNKIELVSRGYQKKFVKNFLYGLKMINSGLISMFDPFVLSKMRIKNEVLINYINNNEEGLGKIYLFNSKGKHSFANKIISLNKEELIETIKLLKYKNEVRKINGWTDFGYGRSKVRILIKKRVFGKNIAYYLFKVSEHDEYEKYLAKGA